jgi:hypothetical protein
VHNDSPNDVSDVVVRFWAIPGGLGTNGNMVGTPKTVTIPANSTLTVNASAPFTSAPQGDHLCAVVSVYSSTGCNINAATALDIPDPGYSETHQCSAWRNTDSMFALMASPFNWRLGLGRLPLHLETPIILEIDAKHVPAEVQNTPAIAKIIDTLRGLGARSNLPLFLLPEFLSTFERVDVAPAVKALSGIDVKKTERGGWQLLPHKGAETTMLEMVGRVPPGAKAGDVLLLHATAKYPKLKEGGGRTVEFLQFVHVVNRKP